MQDPRQWQSGQGKIDTAVLTIKPHGAYFEYGLYLTISGGHMSTYYDTTEIILDFSLPEGSFIEDSWLWVGNDVVQAELIERNTANSIYEGIVQRRQDPSILFKNSQTDYKLRIFPLPPGQSRKVKISYLIPVLWTSSKVSAPLPLEILKSSVEVPDLKIISYSDSTWSNPGITELPLLTFSQLQNNSTRQAVLSAQLINSTVALNYSLPSPVSDGIFLSQYTTSTNSGYYQLAVMPSVLIDTFPPRKTVLLFDYEQNKSVVTPLQVYTKVKAMLQNNYTARDSFNVIFGGTTLTQVSNTWLPCDSATIENIFPQSFTLPTGNIVTIQTLLQRGITFLKTDSGTVSGELLLIANSDSYVSSNSANGLLNSITSFMQPRTFKINILNYADQNTNNYTYSGVVYYGNELAYKKLTETTGGVLVLARSGYYYLNSFNNIAEDIFHKLQYKITDFNIHVGFSNGFSYSNLGYSELEPIYASNTAFFVRRYYGQLPVELSITGLHNNTPIHKLLSINQAFTADSFTRKMWVSKWLNIVEKSNPDIYLKKEAIDSSIQNRILSSYTAFLALEPSDTIAICSVCLQPNDPVVVNINEVSIESVLLSAYPNPFSGSLNIKIELANATDRAALKVYNVMGQMVRRFDIDSTTTDITWNGEDNTGQAVSTGIYILTLETETGKKTIKLLKQ